MFIFSRQTSEADSPDAAENGHEWAEFNLPQANDLLLLRESLGRWRGDIPEGKPAA